MIAFYITGSSSGIGKAIAEQALQIEDSIVYGFSRTCSIENPNYKHVTIDLSNIEEVLSITLKNHPGAYKVVLINNAGIIGDVKPIGKQSNESIVNVFNLNTICPAILSNKFIQAYKGEDVSMVIINISSGAARRPIESWATYCASKAAIDMFSQVQQAENGYDSKNLKIFSIAPGIVDTNMQEQIRTTKPQDFPHLEKFIGYKTKGQLFSPDLVAKKILEVIDKPEVHQNVLLDVRQL
ncbi:MAG: SDR family NAD(P)-dependent oxidoreductase [Bacteroidales bacterium]|nr:MAG: SDR family NAD(P)-dependent oxidoreductase [Bacteroidales bacterium]